MKKIVTITTIAVALAALLLPKVLKDAEPPAPTVESKETDPQDDLFI